MKLQYIKDKADVDIHGLINMAFAWSFVILSAPIIYKYDDQINERGNVAIFLSVIIPALLTNTFIFRTFVYANSFVQIINGQLSIKYKKHPFAGQVEVLVDLKELSSIKLIALRGHFLSPRTYLVYLTSNEMMHELRIHRLSFVSARKRLNNFIEIVGPALSLEVAEKLRYDLATLKTILE